MTPKEKQLLDELYWKSHQDDGNGVLTSREQRQLKHLHNKEQASFNLPGNK